MRQMEQARFREGPRDLIKTVSMNVLQNRVQPQTPNNQQVNQIFANQPKIMNAVASAVACPPATQKTKIRRRPENKVSIPTPYLGLAETIV